MCLLFFCAFFLVLPSFEKSGAQCVAELAQHGRGRLISPVAAGTLHTPPACAPLVHGLTPACQAIMAGA